MTLEQFIPGLKTRCSDCGDPIEGDVRYIEKKGKKEPFCRNCFYKRLGKRLDENEGD